MPRGRSQILLTTLGATAAGALALFLLAVGGASWKWSRTQAAWSASFGTEEQVFARHPPRAANAAATELERLAARLGVDVVPYGRPGHEGPRGRDNEIHELIRDATSFSRAHYAKTARGIDAPPAAVTAFIERHAAELEAVRAHLESGAVPLWESDLARLQAAPIPNLLGHLDLQKLLFLDGLVQIRAGRNDMALRDLEASWSLVRSLQDDPLLIGRLVAMTEARMVLALLRQLPDVPRRWRERLAALEPRQDFVEALKFEIWTWNLMDLRPEWTDMGEFLGSLAKGVMRPYVTYCIADTSDDMRRAIERLERVPALCDYDLDARQAGLAVPVPGWNVVSPVMVPDLSGAVERLARFELDLELTRRVLELEAARAASGRWPAELPGGAASSACPRDRWIYAPADGGMRLGLEREPSWPELMGPDPPPAFRL